MTFREKLERLRLTPSLAPTAAEYRALLELALAVEARPWMIVDSLREGKLRCYGCGVVDAHGATCSLAPIDAALARIKETGK